MRSHWRVTVLALMLIGAFTAPAHAQGFRRLHPAIARLRFIPIASPRTQGPLTTFANLRLAAANGALAMVANGTCGTLGPLTNGANIMLRADASGYLETCGTGGGSTITCADTRVVFADGADTPACDAGFTYNKTADVVSALGGYTDTAHWLLKYGQETVSSVNSVLVRNAADSGYYGLVADSGFFLSQLRSRNVFYQTSTDGTRIPVALSDGIGIKGVGLGANALVSWTDTDDAAYATPDTGIQKSAVGVVAVTLGTTGTFGDLKTRHVLAAGTGPSIAGNATLNTGSKDEAGKITATATATTTAVVTFGTAYTNAPACSATNETAATTRQAYAVSSTTAITFKGSFTNADVISYLCRGF